MGANPAPNRPYEPYTSRTKNGSGCIRSKLYILLDCRATPVYHDANDTALDGAIQRRHLHGHLVRRRGRRPSRRVYRSPS
jgi:hypothetical protein